MKILFPMLLSICIYPNLHTYAQNQKIVDSLTKLIENGNTPDTTLIKAYNDIGIQYAIAAPQKAKTYIHKALSLAQSTKRQRGIAGAENCMGVVYYYEKEYDSASIWFNRALTTNKIAGYQWGEASTLHQIGVINKFQAKYGTAIEKFRQSEAIFKKLNDSISFAKSIESIGASYNLMGHYERAMEYYLRAIEIFEKKENNDGIVRGYNHIGSLMMNQQDYVQALEYLNKALTIVQNEENKFEISALYVLISKCHTRLGHYGIALQYANEALKYRKSMQNKGVIAVVQILIGEIYFHLKNYTKSLQYLNEGLKNSQNNDGNFRIKIDAMNMTAKNYLFIQNLDSAQYHALRATNLSKEIPYLQGENEGYHTLAEIAKNQGKMDLALNYYQNIILMNDSIFNIEKKQHVDKLKAIFEMEQKNEQLELQDIKINLLEQEASASKLQRILLSVGFVLVSIIFTLLFYSYRQKIKSSRLIADHSVLEMEKMNEKLAFKSRELVSYTMHLKNKNQVLDKLKTIVDNSSGTMENEKNSPLDRENLLNIINSELTNDNIWEDLKIYFEEVHPNFYTNTKKAYPQLTQGDLRLIILIKMNFTYKEISNILNITTEGVKKARSRIRKKMNIQSGESLLNSIAGL